MLACFYNLKIVSAGHYFFLWERRRTEGVLPSYMRVRMRVLVLAHTPSCLCVHVHPCVCVRVLGLSGWKRGLQQIPSKLHCLFIWGKHIMQMCSCYHSLVYASHQTFNSETCCNIFTLHAGRSRKSLQSSAVTSFQDMCRLSCTARALPNNIWWCRSRSLAPIWRDSPNVRSLQSLPRSCMETHVASRWWMKYSFHQHLFSLYSLCDRSCNNMT